MAGAGNVAEVKEELSKDVKWNTFSSNGYTSLHHATSNGHAEVAKVLLEANAKVDAALENGSTSLKIAVWKGYDEVTKVLLEANADVKAVEKDGSTLLHDAAVGGHTEVAKVLLEANAEVDAVDEDGSTSLHWAAYTGHTEVAKVLLEANADVMAVDKVGHTSLHDAAHEGHADVAKIILEANAEVVAVDENECTSLHFAARGGHTEVAKVLLEANADVKAVLKDGSTSLHWAACKGHTGVAKVLLEGNADVKAVTKDGHTSLHTAAQEGHAEVAMVLLEANAEVDAADKDGSTSLHLAAQDGHNDVAKVLLEANADVKAVDKFGDTPLHKSAANGQTEMTSTLIGANADVDAVNKARKTPRDLAPLKRKFDKAVSKGLARRGADARRNQKRRASVEPLVVSDDEDDADRDQGAAGPALVPTPRNGKSRAVPVTREPVKRPGDDDVVGRSAKRAAVVTRDAKCGYRSDAAKFVESTGIKPTYFDAEHDRCYCAKCYPSAWPDTISNQGPTPYAVPRGWVRFGLRVHEARADDLDIWNKWSVSFHGVKSVNVLSSVLQHGGLLKPGDKLLDGTILRSSKCAGRQDKVFYTSPTVSYAGLTFYAEPQLWYCGDTPMRASIVLQCRQMPGTFCMQRETMQFERKWPGHLARACPHVDLKQLEWLGDTPAGVIPYGLLVRVWPDTYASPID